ncbi:MAG TPA: hypothetical protein VLZ83_16215 [Edaphocola sp.]|nr:hypothetical protein [Edaphocola sp.]
MEQTVFNQDWTDASYKDKIKEIKDNLFPAFFLILETLNKEIIQYLGTPIVESAMNTANDIHNISERLYFKEKLILLPYILRTIEAGQHTTGSRTAKQVIDETKKIQQMINSFKTNLISLGVKLNKEEEVIKVIPTIETLELQWRTLLDEKLLIYDSFA